MKQSIFKYACLFIVLMALAVVSKAQSKGEIRPAAYRTDSYVPLLKNKRVGIFANNTATIGNTHLVDSLQKLGVKIVIAFGPEHGFRGKADAGEKVDNYEDAATGIPVISLYGKNDVLLKRT